MCILLICEFHTDRGPRLTPSQEALGLQVTHGVSGGTGASTVASVTHVFPWNVQGQNGHCCA